VERSRYRVPWTLLGRDFPVLKWGKYGEMYLRAVVFSPGNVDHNLRTVYKYLVYP
jgi:hypothetical protein